MLYCWPKWWKNQSNSVSAWKTFNFPKFLLVENWFSLMDYLISLNRYFHLNVKWNGFIVDIFNTLTKYLPIIYPIFIFYRENDGILKKIRDNKNRCKSTMILCQSFRSIYIPKILFPFLMLYNYLEIKAMKKVFLKNYASNYIILENWMIIQYPSKKYPSNRP